MSERERERGGEDHHDKCQDDECPQAAALDIYLPLCGTRLCLSVSGVYARMRAGRVNFF